MAGSFKKLYSQPFTDSTNVTVTHNQNKVGLGVMVTSGSNARPDIINYIKFTPGNERNEFVLNLTNQSTGHVIVVESDYIWTNTPAPEVVQALSGSCIEPSTGDICLGTSGATIKFLGNIELSGSGAYSGSFSGSYAGDGSQLTGVSANVSFDRQQATIASSDSVSDNSTSYVDMANATLTTGNLGGAGDYVINFSCKMSNSTKDKYQYIILNVGGSNIQASERAFYSDGGENNKSYTMSTSYLAENISNGTVIKVQYKTTGGTFSVDDATLVIDGLLASGNVS